MSDPGRGGFTVFVGGSAGAIEALADLLGHLSGELPASVLVVLHVGRNGASVLPAILDRVGALHAITPTDGEPLASGLVYVAPRGQHMLVADGRVRLNEGPAEHGVRPAIDPMFRSAARACGPRAIGVVLSGMLDDGTAGLREIRARGGWTLVQTPDEAAFASMPESAIANVAVDFVLPVTQLAAKVQELVSSGHRRSGVQVADRRSAAEPQIGPLSGAEPPGMRTDITCPQCGGVLWEEVSGTVTRFECRAGHTFSPDALLAAQGEGLDSALWRPIRMLQERGALMRRLAVRASSQGRPRSAHLFNEGADDALRRAAEMRRALTNSQRRALDRTRAER